MRGTLSQIANGDRGIVFCWNRDGEEVQPADDYEETRSWIADEGPQETFWSVRRHKNNQPGQHAFLPLKSSTGSTRPLRVDTR